MLWVASADRGGGVGGRLLAAAETEARRRGCTQILTSSFSFQAPGFYERHGYAEYARHPDLPVAGMSDVLLRKMLSDNGSHA